MTVNGEFFVAFNTFLIERSIAEDDGEAIALPFFEIPCFMIFVN
jgi:hypothetical protein